MTEAERKEAEKSWRISIQFMLWIFIVYGNWKRRVIRLYDSGHLPKFKYWWRFEVHEWHPFRAELNYEEKQKLKQQSA